MYDCKIRRRSEGMTPYRDFNQREKVDKRYSVARQSSQFPFHSLLPGDHFAITIGPKRDSVMARQLRHEIRRDANRLGIHIITSFHFEAHSSQWVVLTTHDGKIL